MPGGMRALALIGLVAIVAGGTLLRLEPVRQAGGVEWDFDPAFHIRMTAAVEATGQVPAVDPLGLAPYGKPIPEFLPTLLYPAVAFWHRALRTLGLDLDLDMAAVLFIALSGAMIAVPLYIAARALGLGRGPALLAAAFAAVCPAHVHRTAGHWLRYDALGALLLTGHLAALAAALSASRPRTLNMASAAAALCLGTAVLAWRVPLILVALESIGLLVLLAADRLRRRHVIAILPSLILVMALSPLVPYLRAEPFALSRTGILALSAIVLALVFTRFGPEVRPQQRHLALRIALAAFAIMASIVAAAPSSYDSVGGAIAQKLGFGGNDIGAVLLATNAEMDSPRPAHLVDADYFSALIPLLSLYVLGRRMPRRRPFIADSGTGAGFRLWQAATAVFFILTLLFARNKVLAGPLLALYPALLVAGAWRAQGQGPRRHRRPIAAFAATAIAVGGLLWTANDARRLVAVLPARRAPETNAALHWLRDHARPGDIVLGDWGYGYAIQLVSGIPTVTDGLLEIPAMRRGIADFATALYAEDEATLLALCRAHRATYLWVPAEKRGINAAYAGRRFTDYWTGQQPTARGARTNYVRLIAHPQDLASFAPRFRAGPHLIYAVAPQVQ